MNLLRLTPAALTLLVSACAFSQQDNSVDAKFQPPLVYQSWHMQNYTLKTGEKACAVSSGYNGIMITAAKEAQGVEMVASSTRRIQPGATLTVNANGKSFEAYDTYFTPQVTPPLVDALMKGDKAYLEWSEFSGPAGRERVHVQNIVQLGDFRTKMKACRDSLL